MPMADTEDAKLFHTSFEALKTATIETENDALTVYYQMRSLPELQKLLNQYKNELSSALQRHDTAAFVGIIRKVQSDFLLSFSEKPPQIQADTEKRYKETQIPQEELVEHVDKTKAALAQSRTVSQDVYEKKHSVNREFIGKLVHNYTKLPQLEADVVSDALVSAAEEHPELPTQEIIKAAARSAPALSPTVIQSLQNHKDITLRVSEAAQNSPVVTEQSIVTAILESPEPSTTIAAIRTYASLSPSTPLSDTVQRAQTLAKTADAVASSQGADVPFTGFFTNIAKSGTPLAKAAAPFADAVLSLFPKQTQEAVVTKILGSSWSKEISNNALVQKTIGPLLSSSPVQQAIRNGNKLFVPGGKNVVFTKTQSFFVDVFVTVFHPQVSEVYLQLAGLGNTQMGTSVGSYYAGLLAKEGFSFAARKGAKKAGAVVAEKAAGASVGKVVGGILGSEGGPVGAFVGSLLFDKIIDGIWNGAKKAFNFLTFAWLGKFFSGDYNAPPPSKDPVVIISAVCVGALTLLFVFPILPFSFTGNSSSFQLVQDNAYLQGVGGVPSSGNMAPGTNAGAGFSCVWSGPTPPTTSISRCPAPGTIITQRPYNPTGSHRSADAYDFGCQNGTPIYAAHDGYVASVVTSYPPNMYQYASFGNNIVLVGTDASGQLFCTNYGHLLDVAPATLSAYTNKTLVHAGDLIAYSDTTGYTYGASGLGTGAHLHFGYKGTGSLTLPAGCP